MSIHKYKKGSIISFKNEGKTIHTIAVVSSIEGSNLYCNHAICSIHGLPFKPMRDVYPDYEGELADCATLVDTGEFDLVVDSNLIPREVLINVD